MTAAGSLSTVLALNSGSSSLKFGLYRVGSSATPHVLLEGEVEAIGDRSGKFWANDGSGDRLVSEPSHCQNQQDAMARIGAFLADRTEPQPFAVGHRVVHGGPHLTHHCAINDAVLRQLEAASALAPLHNPPALAVIRFAQQHFPNVAHVACFDTAFHADMPEIARTLPIPRALRADGIWRYGFHGLSCESIVRQLGDDLPDRVIIAHLGNGVSVTAVARGRSIDTSMSLTPAGGVMMGTRCGDLDPGVLIYLMREKRFDAAQLEALVNRQSGLLGLSGIASDMRSLRQAAEQEPDEASNSTADARLAIAMFCYAVRKQIAAMIAALDGLDLLVFAGGIGEHDPAVRAAICDGLSWLGVRLDRARNETSTGLISDRTSRCPVRVIPSQEDAQIAFHTSRIAGRF